MRTRSEADKKSHNWLEVMEVPQKKPLLSELQARDIQLGTAREQTAAPGPCLKHRTTSNLWAVVEIAPFWDQAEQAKASNPMGSPA